MDKHITTPITEEVTKDLKSGDYVYITGQSMWQEMPHTKE